MVQYYKGCHYVHAKQLMFLMWCCSSYPAMLDKDYVHTQAQFQWHVLEGGPPRSSLAPPKVVLRPSLSRSSQSEGNLASQGALGAWVSEGGRTANRELFDKWQTTCYYPSLPLLLSLSFLPLPLRIASIHTICSHTSHVHIQAHMCAATRVLVCGAYQQSIMMVYMGLGHPGGGGSLSSRRCIERICNDRSKG